MVWSSKGVEERGSTELKEIIFIVTGGNPTGKPIKEEKEDEQIKGKLDQ